MGCKPIVKSTSSFFLGNFYYILGDQLIKITNNSLLVKKINVRVDYK